MNPIGDALKAMTMHITAAREARRRDAQERRKAAEELLAETQGSTTDKVEKPADKPPEAPKPAESDAAKQLKFLLVAKAINDQEQKDAADLAAPQRPRGPGEPGQGAG